MKNILYILLGIIVVPALVYSASIFTTKQGGTGTGTQPTLGQVLLGNADGTYSPVATSSLGITGGGSFPTADGFVQNSSSSFNIGGTTTIGKLNGVFYVDGVNYAKTSTGIQAAINACPNYNCVVNVNGDYSMTSPLNFAGKQSISIKGQSASTTRFVVTSGFSGAYIIDDTSGSSYNDIEISGITFDSHAKRSAAIRIGTSTNLYIHDNTFTGVRTPSLWGVKIGTTNVATFSELNYSNNVRFENNIFEDNDFGTFEGLLAVQWRNSTINNNFVETSTSSNAYMLLCYVFCDSVEMAGNRINNYGGHAIGAQQSTRINMHDNQIIMTGEGYRGLTTVNVTDSIISGNTVYGNSGTSSVGVFIFDRNVGADGNANQYPTTTNIIISKNIFDSVRYGFAMSTGGSGYYTQQSNINLQGNTYTNIGTLPIDIGYDATNGDVYGPISISDERIFSWGTTIGANVGAMRIRGASTSPGSMSNVSIYNNYIAPTSYTNGNAITFVASNPKILVGNSVVGTGILNPIFRFIDGSVTTSTAQVIYGNIVSTTTNFNWQNETGDVVGFVDNAGRLGLNTESPTEQLTVNGNIDFAATNNGDYIKAYSGANHIFSFSRQLNPTIGSLSVSALGGIGFKAGRSSPFDGSTAYDGVFSTSGDFGIATNTPDERLTVNGNIKSVSFGSNSSFIGAYNGATHIFSFSRQSSPSNASLGISAFGGIGFKTNSSSIATTSFDVVFTNTGNVGIGSSTPPYKLVVTGTSSLRDTIPETTNTYSLGTAALRWLNGFFTSINAINASSTNATTTNLTFRGIAGQLLAVDANGRVIGTTTPTGGTFSSSSAMTIGTLYSTSTLNLLGLLRDSTNASGTNGQVLQSTGAGVQWVTNAAAGVSGTGSKGLLALWDSASSLVTSLFMDNGTVTGVGATSSLVRFNVQGSGTLDPFNVSSSTGVSLFSIGNTGRIMVGSGTPSSLLTVNQSTTTFQAPLSGTSAHFIGQSGSPFRMSIDTFSGASTFGSQIQFRRALGTSDTPTAVTASSTLFTIASDGYGTTGFHASSITSISGMAEGPFTDTSAPSILRFFTTATGTVTSEERFIIGSNGRLSMGTTSVETVATTSPYLKLDFFARDLAGNTVLSTKIASSTEMTLQPSFASRRITMWTSGGSATGYQYGLSQTSSSTGVDTVPTFTNGYTSQQRTLFSTVITRLNQQVGIRSNLHYFRSATTSFGGFYAVADFGFTSWTAGNRFYTGFSTCTSGDCIASSTTIVNRQDIAGFMVDGMTNTLTFATNDNAGVISTTSIPNMPNFAANSRFRTYIYSPAGNPNIYWRIDNMISGLKIAEGVATTNLMRQNVNHAYINLCSNGANTAANACQLGMMRFYIESQ